MLQKLALASVCFAGWCAVADVQNSLPGDILCRQAVTQQILTLQSRDQWARLGARGMDGSIRWLTPTQKVGEWIEAQVFLNKEVVLRRLTSRQVETRTFDLKTCQLRQVRFRPVRESESSEAAFRDADLASLLASGQAGLIYVWSPHMPYSYVPNREHKTGFQILSELAGQKGLRLTVLLDPMASPEYALRSLRAHKLTLPPDGLRQVRSIELTLRSALTHYPVLLVYKNGQLARFTYPGIGTQQEYANYIEEQLHALAP